MNELTSTSYKDVLSSYELFMDLDMRRKIRQLDPDVLRILGFDSLESDVTIHVITSTATTQYIAMTDVPLTDQVLSTLGGGEATISSATTVGTASCAFTFCSTASSFGCASSVSTAGSVE